MGPWPEYGSFERQKLNPSLAKGFSWDLFEDSHRILSLDQQIPSSRGQGFGAYHLCQAAGLKYRSSLPQIAWTRIFLHESEDQVVVGIEHFYRQFLVSRFKYMEW
jgi:hypothetical protein